MNAQPRLTLVHPPLGDPTVPYHATAYLAGSLRSRGFADAAQRDANAEFVNWCVSQKTFVEMVAEARDRTRCLGSKTALDLDEQAELYELWCRREIAHEDVARAMATQRRLERFLDFDAYTRSVQVIRDYFGLIGALSHPGAIVDFVLVPNGRFSFTSFADLLNGELSRSVCWPFYRFLDDTWARDPVICGTTCLGISVTYQHQLYHALALARWFRERWPERTVLLGGTEISQIYRSVRDRAALRALFALCDGFVVGEAETAICQIADAGFEFEPGSKIQNLITYDPARDEIHVPKMQAYEDLRSIASPHYDYAWELYMAPVRAINYAPTRGCYWNRCAFCSYGLSDDGPTAPWRVRPPALVARELADVCDQQNIGYVYFAVDAISPAYLEKLSDALVEHGTRFKWSAEMRLEKVFRRKLCDKLARSGCVSALFGMESGSQRVLDAMDKGTKVEHMVESVRHFAEAGIAVQLMTFSGFPGETTEDRAQTLRFLRRCSSHWSNGGMGSFVLLDGSIIAKEPARFGVQVKSVEGCDIDAIRDFEFVQFEDAAERANDNDDFVIAQGKNLFPRSFPRPWAGGADTLHSMVYYHHLGRSFFREHPLQDAFRAVVPADDEALARSSIRLHAGMSDSFFDMRLVLASVEQWRQRHTLTGSPEQAQTHAAYESAVAQIPSVRRSDALRYYLQHRGKSVEVPEVAYTLIGDAVANGSAVADMCAALPPEAAQRFLRYVRKLGNLGVIEFVRAD
jgi:Radical SAM superfamily